MNYYIETYQDGKQLLGSDFTTIVRDAKTGRKLRNRIKSHIARMYSLRAIKSHLNKPYSILVRDFEGRVISNQVEYPGSINPKHIGQ